MSICRVRPFRHPRAFALFLLAVIVAVPSLSAAAEPALPSLDLQIDRSTRLLVLAPHPDDEMLGAGGLIARVAAAGGAVRVVLMTSGDAFAQSLALTLRRTNPDAADFRRFGDVRQRETTTALHQLQVPRASILFLGFPDGGVCTMAAQFATEPSCAVQSPYTGRDRPPVAQQLLPDTAYRGPDALRELNHVLDTFEPTLIVLPHPQDNHPDHCATSIFGRAAVHDYVSHYTRVHPRVLYSLVHYPNWPYGTPDTAMQPPAGLLPLSGAWKTLSLTQAEAATKRMAMTAYATQTPVIGDLMTAMTRHDELFLDGEPQPATQCWCDASTTSTDLSLGRHPRTLATR